MAAKVKIIPMLRDFLRKNHYELVDKYVIKDGKKHKCAIICPGGGYYAVCSFIEGEPLAKELNKKGISAFILYYRVKEEAVHPNPQDDLAKAIREIMDKADYYNIDMEGYSIWGASAGGHLVGSFGTSKMGYKKYDLPKPGALVLTYPVITLEKELTHEGTREAHIGKDADAECERAHSVHTNVDADYPPTYIWCGDSDNTVPPENTKMMDAALTENNISHQCTIFPGVDHGVGLDIGGNAEGWLDEAYKFWMKELGQE